MTTTYGFFLHKVIYFLPSKEAWGSKDDFVGPNQTTANVNIVFTKHKVLSEFSLFLGAGGGQSGPEKLEGNENK